MCMVYVNGILVIYYTYVVSAKVVSCGIVII